MDTSEFTVDVKVSGECVTRNGVSSISRMVAHQNNGETSLKFVSDKLKRSLNSGARIATEDMDKFCQAWIEARGCSLNGVPSGEDYINAMELTLDNVMENLKLARAMARRASQAVQRSH